jgi:hypothetical protein
MTLNVDNKTMQRNVPVVAVDRHHVVHKTDLIMLVSISNSDFTRVSIKKRQVIVDMQNRTWLTYETVVATDQIHVLLKTDMKILISDSNIDSNTRKNNNTNAIILL